MAVKNQGRKPDVAAIRKRCNDRMLFNLAPEFLGYINELCDEVDRLEVKCKTLKEERDRAIDRLAASF